MLFEAQQLRRARIDYHLQEGHISNIEHREISLRARLDELPDPREVPWARLSASLFLSSVSS
jgi:hypothetical protein